MLAAMNSLMTGSAAWAAAAMTRLRSEIVFFRK